MPVIIKQGKLPEEKIIETTCRNCQTVFSFMPKEATIVGDQRDGDYYNVNCPFCVKLCCISITRGTR